MARTKITKIPANFGVKEPRQIPNIFKTHATIGMHHFFSGGFSIWELNPFRAPEPLSTLNPSNFVPKNGFPVVKGLRPLPKTDLEKKKTATG